jgi:LmbE family N-acetylglucosaminyl deacetylase
MKKALAAAVILVLSSFFFMADVQSKDQLRILIIGAHPDDAEKAGGTAALYKAAGNQVRLVSMTNGDAGHFKLGGAELAKIRREEARCAGAVIGAEYIVLDNHDGQLLPSLENRWQVIRLIREFKADIVITHRPNDYHPDHRNTGILVLDAAYMVTVPMLMKEVPYLPKNPVVLYMSDRFSKPASFKPDVVIGIDAVIEKKMDMYHCHKSQMYEWLPFNAGILEQVPKNDLERRAWMAASRKKDSAAVADQYRAKLIELYGEEKGARIRYAEAFEDSEYGSPLTPENLKVLFPFFI